MYKVIDRFFVGLLALVVLVFCGAAVVFAWNATALEELIRWLYASWIHPASVTAGCVVLILIALRVLFFAGRAPAEGPRILVTAGELGSVEITMDTLGQLVDAYMTDVEAVTDTRYNLRPGEKGLGIYLRVAMASGGAIPAVSGAVQSGLKEFIERTTGIAVAEVGILVDNPPAPKVREAKAPVKAPAPRAAVQTVVPAARDDSPDEAAHS